MFSLLLIYLLFLSNVFAKHQIVPLLVTKQQHTTISYLQYTKTQNRQYFGIDFTQFQNQEHRFKDQTIYLQIEKQKFREPSFNCFVNTSIKHLFYDKKMDVLMD